MPRADDDGAAGEHDVDFVVGAAHGETDPATSVRDTPGGSRPSANAWRQRRTLAGAAVALVAIGLVVRAVDGPRAGKHRAASTSVSPSAPAPSIPASASAPFEPSAAPTVRIAVPEKGRVSLMAAAPPPRCPETVIGGNLCTDSVRVPSAPLAAVLRYFPNARPLAAYSQDYYIDNEHPKVSLAYRQFTVDAAGAVVLVLVRSTADGDQDMTATGDDGRHAVALAILVRDHLTVRAQAVAPSGQAPPLHSLLGLVADRRVVAP